MDIDAIFSKKKKKIIEPKEKNVEIDMSFADSRGTMKNHTSRTSEGYRIYSKKDLRLDSQCLETEDCPFDCNCCY